MIRIQGTAMVRVDYIVELPMSESQFDSLSSKAQDELIDNAIDWADACRNGQLDSLDVDDLIELEDEDEPQDSLG